MGTSSSHRYHTVRLDQDVIPDRIFTPLPPILCNPGIMMAIDPTPYEQNGGMLKYRMSVKVKMRQDGTYATDEEWKSMLMRCNPYLTESSFIPLDMPVPTYDHNISQAKKKKVQAIQVS